MLTACSGSRRGMSAASYSPAAYRDATSSRPSDSAGGTPEFSWSRLGATGSTEVMGGAQPPAWVAAAQRCGGSNNSTGATPPSAPASHQRLAAAAAVARKCLDLGLPRLAVLPIATPQQQQHPPDQQLKQEQAAAAAQRQVAQATSQLQKQSTVLASALESQSVQLARQQQLLQEVVQGMLFVVAKTGSTGASAAPPHAAALAAAHSAAPVEHSKQQQLVQSMPQPAAQPAAHCRNDKPAAQPQQSACPGGQQQASTLLQDLANIVARQSAAQPQLQRGSRPLLQYIHPLQDTSWGAAVRVAHTPSCVPASPLRQPLQTHGAAAADQLCSHPQPQETGRVTPRLNRAAQLRVGAVRPATQQWHQGEAALATAPRASGGGAPAEEADTEPQPSSNKRALHGSAKPGWDDSTVVQRPSPAAKRAPRLDDPPERQRRPAGASASLAAQLLMQELKKYRLRQRPRPAAARQEQQQQQQEKARSAPAPAAASGPRLPAHGAALPLGRVQHAGHANKAKETVQPRQGGQIPAGVTAMSNKMHAPALPELGNAPAEVVEPCSPVGDAVAGSCALQPAASGCSNQIIGVGSRKNDPPAAASGMMAAAQAACSCGGRPAVGGGLAAADAAGGGSAAAAAADNTSCAKVGTLGDAGAASLAAAAVAGGGELSLVPASQEQLLEVCDAVIEQLLLGELLPSRVAG